MASVSKDRGRDGEFNGCRTLQFVNTNGIRKSVRLGKVSAKGANTIKTKVEAILEAKFAGRSLDPEVADWVGRQAKDNTTLYDKLATHGLLPRRKQADATTLGAYVEGYIAGRLPAVKPNTVRIYRHTRDNLLSYFGANTPLAEITPGDADEFRAWLTLPKTESSDGRQGRGLGDNTARKCCSVSRQFLEAAKRKRLIADNPFAEMREGVAIRANKSRDYFVTRAEADKIIEHCPDHEWKLIVALTRYGGLRSPSEVLELTWGDVNWDHERITVRSPKTAHHEGHEARTIPLFHELRKPLQVALDALLEDFDPKANRLSEQPVIRRYRDSSKNLRTALRRIIIRAGMQPWEKLFMNMRASRATELAAEFPAHVAADWLGHSAMVAQKHYWRTTEDDFARALQKCMQQSAETVGNDAQAATEKTKKPVEMPVSTGSEYTPQESNL